LTLTGPLRLQPDTEQATPHETFRLIPSGEEFVLQALIGDAWRPLYRFGLQEQLLPDYEVTSWYLSNHPESQFVTTLMAARPEPDRRYALRNNQLAVYHRDGRTEQRVLTSAAEMRQALEGEFHVRLPDVPEMDAAFARLIAQSAAISAL
jgi:N-hydroxyarylamine O-acetyltransferase